MVHRNHRVRILWGGLGVFAWGWFIWEAQRVVAQREAAASLGAAFSLVCTHWSIAQAGPARGRSLRQRNSSAASPSRTNPLRDRRHPNFWMFWPVMGAVGLGLALSTIDKRIWDLVFAGTIFYLCGFVLVDRGRRKVLGYHPDLYLAVERQISEDDLRPELLVHHPSRQPEYSGWYAFAKEQDENSPDLVVWSMQDLVDHAPEAGRPFREGCGRWRWEQTERAYVPACSHQTPG